MQRWRGEGIAVRDDFPVHRKKPELLWIFRRYARDLDEEGFKQFLTEKLGMQLEEENYAAAMSAFWNLVRSFEREPHR